MKKSQILRFIYFTNKYLFFYFISKRTSYFFAAKAAPRKFMAPLLMRTQPGSALTCSHELRASKFYNGSKSFHGHRRNTREHQQRIPCKRNDQPGRRRSNGGLVSRFTNGRRPDSAIAVFAPRQKRMAETLRPIGRSQSVPQIAGSVCGLHLPHLFMQGGIYLPNTGATPTENGREEPLVPVQSVQNHQPRHGIIYVHPAQTRFTML